jgi:hypothetical protein
VSKPDASVIWRRLDVPGHEAARLAPQDSEWHLSGTAVFADAGRACSLEYLVVCDRDWRTRSGLVRGWLGDELIALEIIAESGRWRLNGTETPAVDGCVDLDLNFSPSTNLIPIRRLDLAVGAGARVRAAWLRFPDFVLEPLDQMYERTGIESYRYESSGGSFVRDLSVNAAGFVIDYPDLWQLESAR